MKGARVAEVAPHRRPVHPDTVRCALLEEQLRAVYASTSWRLTKPIRWLIRLARSPRAALLELPRAALRRLVVRMPGNTSLRRMAGAFEARYPEPHALAPILAVKPVVEPAHAIHNPRNRIGPPFATILHAELAQQQAAK